MEVCIVGGGLAGLACAISLAGAFSHREITITLLELRDFRSKGATLGLALNGQKALAEICPSFLEELKGMGILMEEGGYMLPWYRVRDGLLDKARSMPTIQIMTNTNVTSISQDASSVTIEALQKDDGQPSMPVKLQADFVIGADGVHSTVRNYLKNAPSAVPSNAVCWRGFVDEVPAEISHLLEIPIHKLILAGKYTVFIFNYTTVIPGLLCWVVSSKDVNAQSAIECLTALDDEKERDDVRILLEASSKESLEYRSELGTVPLSGAWAGDGRVTLIGDAAHAIRPASGLGGSLAFEDVAILARELVKNSTDCEAALREFENKRLPRCKAIQEDQTRRSEAAYLDDEARKKLEWHPDYRDWVFCGPDASPNPPTQIYCE